MPRGKPKLKTAMLTIRVSPRVKIAAEMAAEQDRRSVANLIEVLILNHCDRLGIHPETKLAKEAVT